MEQYLMEGIIGPMMLLGVFGNVNVIVAIARKKALRSKGSMLVFVLAISHLVCNISELRVLIFRFRFQTMKGRQCFEYNIPYSFAIMFQSALFLSMALDLCFCILLPFKHLIWPKTKYILIMCIMPTCFAAIIFGLNFLFVTDEDAPFCAFMLIRTAKKEEEEDDDDSAMDDGVFELISSSVVVCNIITVVIIIVSVLIAVRKSSIMRDHRHSTNSRRSSTVEERRKVFRSTFYMSAIYIFSWMLSSFCFRILLAIYDDEKDIIEFMPYLAIITMPNFCQAFFVTYFRSHRFRKAYKEHFHVLTCGFLFPKVFEQPEIRAGDSGTNQPVQSDSDTKTTKDGPKKTVRYSEDYVI